MRVICAARRVVGCGAQMESLRPSTKRLYKETQFLGRQESVRAKQTRLPALGLLPLELEFC
jgi:hypothetical protein